MKLPFLPQQPSQPLPNAHPHGTVKVLPADFFVRIAEEVWRAGKRTDRAAREVDEDRLKGLRDSLNRLNDVLQDYSVEIKDYSGEKYDEGLRVDIVHVEGDTARECPLWITETVKPTISFGGMVINRGQVVLSTEPPEVEAK